MTKRHSGATSVLVIRLTMTRRVGEHLIGNLQRRCYAIVQSYSMVVIEQTWRPIAGGIPHARDRTIIMVMEHTIDNRNLSNICERFEPTRSTSTLDLYFFRPYLDRPSGSDAYTGLDAIRFIDNDAKL